MALWQFYPYMVQEAFARGAAVLYRPCRYNELNACADLVARGVSSPFHSAVPRIWRNWLVEERATLFVVDDVAGRPAAFVACAFVSDGALTRLRKEPSPTMALYAAELAGDSMVLSSEEISKANGAEELNLLVVHAALNDVDLRSPEGRYTLSVAASGFYFFHMGYRLRTLSFSSTDAPLLTGANASARLTLVDLSIPTFRGLTVGPCDLITIRANDVQAGAVNVGSYLFCARIPRFFYTRAQRELLVRALLGDSDVEAAEALSVSVDAIKQTWRGAFQRTTRVAPGLLSEPAALRDGVRGTEKRRRLLEYLRNNLVELRPFPMSTHAGRSGGAA